jgi:hypothetical protein
VTPVEPAIVPNTRRIVLAEKQPEYAPLVARVGLEEYDQIGAQVTVTTEWDPTDEERAVLAAGGRVRLKTLTFGKPFQPVVLDVVAGA